MKCDSCDFITGYTLGQDECGAGYYTEYCVKGHWSGSETEPQDEKQAIKMHLNPEIDFWKDCKDYKLKESL
jgi:hypothetical protein